MQAQVLLGFECMSLHALFASHVQVSAHDFRHVGGLGTGAFVYSILGIGGTSRWLM